MTVLGVYFEVRLDWGWLEIGGISLAHPAWGVIDTSPLWGSGAAKGDDVPMPYASRRPGPRRFAGGDLHSLRFVCTGLADPDGSAPASADPFVQCQTNMAYLHANVFDPVDTGTGTRSCTWHLPSGATVTADVRARLPKDGVTHHARGVLRGVLELDDPRGELHL